MQHKYRLRQLLLSRFVVIVIACIGAYIPDHNPGSANDVQRFEISQYTKKFPDYFLGGFTKWDSAYFLGIARNGAYKQEKELVFYPLYPILLRILYNLLSGYDAFDHSVVTGPSYLLVVVGLVLNFIASYFASCSLEEILNDLTTNCHGDLENDSNLIVATALTLFHFNPATIFFTTTYTESVYCGLSWFSILLFQRSSCYYFTNVSKNGSRTTWPLLHIVWLLLTSSATFLASATRSNAIFQLAFVPNILHDIKWNRSYEISETMFRRRISVIIELISVIVIVTSIVLPHIIWNDYSHNLSNEISGNCEGLACNNANIDRACNINTKHRYFPFDSVYSRLQRDYWNVGFLRQYKWAQMPNFMLAVPVVTLSLHTLCASALTFIRNDNMNISKDVIGDPRSSNYLMVFTSFVKQFVITFRSGPSGRSVAHKCHFVHFSVLLFVCIFIAHVQVSTRVLFSSCPILYLGIAKLLRYCSGRSDRFYNDLVARLIYGYFGVYFVLGSLLHTNFYPWT